MTAIDDDTAKTAPASTEGGLPIAAAIGTKSLIAAIIIMPFIAVAAVAGVLLFAKARPQPDATPAPASSDYVRLPPDGKIAETYSDGRHLIVRIEAPTGARIDIFDIGTGERVRTIAIESPSGGVSADDR